MINLFYGDKSDRRYYPLILEWYVGKVVFLDFSLISSDRDSLITDLHALKGTTQTYDIRGQTVDHSTGIRGIIGQPYLVYPKETLDLLDDNEYRQVIRPIIQNYIHVCDKTNEAELALQLIY